MNDNFSPRVKNVVNTGKLEAIRMKHSVVGTEHLLLGILKETDGSAFEYTYLAEKNGITCQFY